MIFWADALTISNLLPFVRMSSFSFWSWSRLTVLRQVEYRRSVSPLGRRVVIWEDHKFQVLTKMLSMCPLSLWFLLALVPICNIFLPYHFWCCGRVQIAARRIHLDLKWFYATVLYCSCFHLPSALVSSSLHKHIFNFWIVIISVQFPKSYFSK